mmetsp:Transcript_17334/g.40686  ORF Transcript_17334/g.40686 Transcript_17334/m.40686 type:complete len:207 (+) Transcript_17334:7038-7658(+)
MKSTNSRYEIIPSPSASNLYISFDTSRLDKRMSSFSSMRRNSRRSIWPPPVRSISSNSRPKFGRPLRVSLNRCSSSRSSRSTDDVSSSRRGIFSAFTKSRYMITPRRDECWNRSISERVSLRVRSMPSLRMPSCSSRSSRAPSPFSSKCSKHSMKSRPLSSTARITCCFRRFSTSSMSSSSTPDLPLASSNLTSDGSTRVSFSPSS